MSGLPQLLPMIVRRSWLANSTNAIFTTLSRRGGCLNRTPCPCGSDPAYVAREGVASRNRAQP
jgi:hypothetical protein